MVVRKDIFYLSSSGLINTEAWLDHIAMQRPGSRLRLIRHAIELTKLTGTVRHTALGVSYLQQSLTMADILLDLMLDEDTICAALLYNSVYYTELSLNVVEEQLNRNVSKLLRGALRMNHISSFTTVKNVKQNQLENFRKMLLSIADDMRVVLLKLAERVAWMRAAKQNKIRTSLSRQYARDTLNIYAPLANRLGIDALRYELEDLAMDQLAPTLYRNMKQLLNERLLDREQYIKELVLAIEIILAKVGIQAFKITSRVKNFYGIYRKMRQKKLNFHEIYDLNAIRIMVSTIDECYKVVDALNTVWTSVPGQFDDYIQSPKGNNYRSIHTAIYGAHDKVIEVQIRTFEMHQESEHGVAAHWEYKEGVPHKTDYHSKIAWLRQVITWQKELVTNGIYLMPELTATLDDRVYVLTPADDIVDLPKGATALDFAYYIHPDMGHYCHRVNVNGEEKPLSYGLHTGDKVEIFTSKQPQLSWDWLNPNLGYLNTAQAKANVLHWFQQKDYYQHIVTGKLLLERGCRKLGLKIIDYDKLANELQYKSKKELLAALGSGELRIVQVLHVLHRYSQKLVEPLPEFSQTEALDQISQAPSDLTIGKPFDASFDGKLPLANCCKPMPGDPICGSLTEIDGIVLHRQNCPQLMQPHPQNTLQHVMEPSPTYEVNAIATSPTTIYVEALSEYSVLEKIMSLLQSYTIEMLGLSTTYHPIQARSYIILSLKASQMDLLTLFLNSLRNTEHVITADIQ
jgi:GTP pyrophosphokinase